MTFLKGVAFKLSKEMDVNEENSMDTASEQHTNCMLDAILPSVMRTIISETDIADNETMVENDLILKEKEEEEFNTNIFEKFSPIVNSIDETNTGTFSNKMEICQFQEVSCKSEETLKASDQDLGNVPFLLDLEEVSSNKKDLLKEEKDEVGLSINIFEDVNENDDEIVEINSELSLQNKSELVDFKEFTKSDETLQITDQSVSLDRGLECSFIEAFNEYFSEDDQNQVNPLDSTVDLKDKRHKRRREKKKRRKRWRKNSIEKPLKKKKLPPNYFISLRIRNEKIHENIRLLQETIINQNEKLKPALIALPTLHLTMLVIRINSKEEVQRAHTAMLKAAVRLHGEFQWPFCLEFKGLSKFSNKVLFVEILPPLEKLNKIFQIVKESFEELNFELPDKREFNAHLTVLKLSRHHSLLRKGAPKVQLELYEDYKDMDFGVEEIDSLQLCAMNIAKAEDGFYYCSKEICLSDFSADHQLLSNSDEDKIELCNNEALLTIPTTDISLNVIHQDRNITDSPEHLTSEELSNNKVVALPFMDTPQSKVPTSHSNASDFKSSADVAENILCDKNIAANINFQAPSPPENIEVPEEHVNDTLNACLCISALAASISNNDTTTSNISAEHMDITMSNDVSKVPSSISITEGLSHFSNDKQINDLSDMSFDNISNMATEISSSIDISLNEGLFNSGICEDKILNDSVEKTVDNLVSIISSEISAPADISHNDGSLNSGIFDDNALMDSIEKNVETMVSINASDISSPGDIVKTVELSH